MRQKNKKKKKRIKKERPDKEEGKEGEAYRHGDGTKRVRVEEHTGGKK